MERVGQREIRHGLLGYLEYINKRREIREGKRYEELKSSVRDKDKHKKVK